MPSEFVELEASDLVDCLARAAATAAAMRPASGAGMRGCGCGRAWPPNACQQSRQKWRAGQMSAALPPPSPPAKSSAPVRGRSGERQSDLGPISPALIALTTIPCNPHPHRSLSEGNCGRMLGARARSPPACLSGTDLRVLRAIPGRPDNPNAESSAQAVLLRPVGAAMPYMHTVYACLI